MRVPLRGLGAALSLAKYGAHSAADCLNRKKTLCFISVRGGLCKSHSISKGICRFLGAYFMVFTLQRIAWFALAHCVLSICAGACAPQDTPLTQSVTLLLLNTTKICAPRFRLCGPSGPFRGHRFRFCSGVVHILIQNPSFCVGVVQILNSPWILTVSGSNLNRISI